MVPTEAQEIIDRLGLNPLPDEGGYYKETYRSHHKIDVRDTDGHTHSRSAGTAIYYLITQRGFSALHRLKYDEVFHFYQGDAAEMIIIEPSGSHRIIELGQDVKNGQIPQVVVPADAWQGTRLKDGGKWALFGTTMAPGFDFSDFELGSYEDLSRRLPEIKSLLRKYIR